MEHSEKEEQLRRESAVERWDRGTGSAMCAMGWAFRLLWPELLTPVERNHALLALELTAGMAELNLIPVCVSCEQPWHQSSGFVRRSQGRFVPVCKRCASEFARWLAGWSKHAKKVNKRSKQRVYFYEHNGGAL